MKAKTIAIVANKGGVAKTSTALNLAYGLMNKDKRVLLIDLDPSSNATAVVLDQDENVSVSEQGAEKYREIFIEKQKDMPRIKACYEAMHEYLQQVELPCDIHDILEKELDIHLGIRKTRFKDLDIVPASNLLSTTDIKLKEAFNRSNRLRRAIQKVEDEYDFIIIDCPAGIEQGFKTAIAAADRAIVVTMPEVSAVRDADKIIGELGRAEKDNISLIVNRIRPQMVQSGDMMDMNDIDDILSIKCIGQVPDDEMVVTSANRGEPLVGNGKSQAGMAYANIVRRILGEDVPFMTFKADGLFTRLKKALGI